MERISWVPKKIIYEHNYYEGFTSDAFDLILETSNSKFKIEAL